MSEDRFTKLEREALLDAAHRYGYWGLFKRKTTAKLAARGYFVKKHHLIYGVQWRLTEKGRKAAEALKRIGLDPDEVVRR